MAQPQSTASTASNRAAARAAKRVAPHDATPAKVADQPVAPLVVAQPPVQLASAPRYPVILTLAQDGAGGDSQYEVMLTDAQIRRLLADDESPRFIRLPDRYSGPTPGRPPRYVRIANISEVQIHGGWTPPAEDDLEWATTREH